MQKSSKKNRLSSHRQACGLFTIKLQLCTFLGNEYAEKDAGSFKKTSKSVTDGIAGSRKNKAGILLQGKIKKRREAFGAMSFS